MKLRPHHLFCMQFFIGKGYDSAFTQNMTRICDALHTDPDQEITIVFSSDDLCDCCPNRQADGGCLTDKKVRCFDSRVASLLNLQENHYFWRRLLTQVQHVLNRKTLKQVCGNCEWQKKGICVIPDASRPVRS